MGMTLGVCGGVNEVAAMSNRDSFPPRMMILIPMHTSLERTIILLLLQLLNKRTDEKKALTNISFTLFESSRIN
jgi:GTP-sensing pleiotropic transcriptional regulator CodY